MVLFVGYQAVGTLGRILIDGAKHVKLFNEDIQVEAEIDTLPGVSGHADKAGLLRWLGGFAEKPALVFVNHGDPETVDAFAACLNDELGYHAYAPYSGACFDLLRRSFVRMPEGKPVEKKSDGGKQRRTSPTYTRLVEAAERLLRIAKGLEGHANKELAGYADSITHLADKMER